MAPAPQRGSFLCVPVLDVARGVVAGYQLIDDPLDPDAGPSARTARAAGLLQAALSAPALPPNTFLSVPVALDAVASPQVTAALAVRPDLRGVVLDVTHFTPTLPDGADEALAAVTAAGARIAVGGEGMPQPDLTSIVRLRPSIIRLGRAWVEGVDTSAAKRSTIEVTGRLAGQLDAWVLADGVESAAELRALAELDVPLAQGPFIGEPGPPWPSLGDAAGTSAPVGSFVSDGALRSLVQAVPWVRVGTEPPPSAPEGTVVVVLDGTPRPVAVLTRTADHWHERVSMTVLVDTPARDALTRALARDRATRLDPLVCTDAAGRYLGVVPIDRLTAHVVAG